MENYRIGEEILDKTSFVRNVRVEGEWMQIHISDEERNEIQKRLLGEQMYIYNLAYKAAETVMKQNMTRPTPRMVHDFALQMTERTTPHIHMVFLNFLEQKARMVRELAKEQPVKNDPEPVIETEAQAPVSTPGNRFEEKNNELYINDKKALKAWESFSGWYWFATEKVRDQESLINGKPVKDTIFMCKYQ